MLVRLSCALICSRCCCIEEVSYDDGFGDEVYGWLLISIVSVRDCVQNHDLVEASKQ